MIISVTFVQGLVSWLKKKVSAELKGIEALFSTENS
jgi:hypothetical protein